MKAICSATRVFSIEPDSATIRQGETGVEVVNAGEVKYIVGGLELSEVQVLPITIEASGVDPIDLVIDHGDVKVRPDYSDVLADASRKLADSKIKKNEQINQWREAANKGTFPHAGKVVACDSLSRGDIDAVANHIALFGTFPVGFPGGWKAADNSIIPLPDIAAFKALFTSMTEQGTANFNRSQQLKQQLAAATTQADVDAIVW